MYEKGDCIAAKIIIGRFKTPISSILVVDKDDFKLLQDSFRAALNIEPINLIRQPENFLKPYAPQRTILD